MKKSLGLAFIAVTVIFAACTKLKTTDVGTGLIPPIDGVTTKDTFFEVETVNAAQDTIRVSYSGDHVLGYVNNPLFGKTLAKVNVELKPTYFPYTFEKSKDSLFLDSVVLVLSYRATWGDTMQNLALNVYEVSQADRMKGDSVYLTTKDFATTGSSLTYSGGAVTIDTKRLTDSLHMGAEQATNQIRLRLTDALGNKLLKGYDSTTAYKSDSAFSTYFAGFQIAPQSTGNALMRVNLTDTNTKVALYYRVRKDATSFDTSVRYFRYNSTSFSGTSNTVLRDRSSGEIAAHFPRPDLTKDSLLYLQASPGVYAKIKIPGLGSMRNVIVHRAELLMEQVASDPVNDGYFTPPALFLCGYGDDSAHKYVMSPDINVSFTGSYYVVGNMAEYGAYPTKRVSPAGVTTAAYNFNVSRWVQGIVTRHVAVDSLALMAPYNQLVSVSKNASFFAYTSANPVNYPAIGQVRLGGGSHSKQKMKLRVIYSIIKGN